MLIIEDKADLLETERPRRASLPTHSRRISSHDLTKALQKLTTKSDDYYKQGSITPKRRYGGHRRSTSMDVISVQRSIDSLRSDVLQRNRQVQNNHHSPESRK